MNDRIPRSLTRGIVESFIRKYKPPELDDPHEQEDEYGRHQGKLDKSLASGPVRDERPSHVGGFGKSFTT